MIIIGIDPGSRATGYGVINSNGSNHQCLAYGVLRIAKSSFGVQLGEIFDGLTILLKEFTPKEAAIEKVFVRHNVSSALKLGQARGAAIVAVAKHALPLFEYSPSEVKQAAAGYGAASKSQVQQMVKILLHLKEAPPQDAADALAIAICHAHMRKRWAILEKVRQLYA